MNSFRALKIRNSKWTKLYSDIFYHIIRNPNSTPSSFRRKIEAMAWDSAIHADAGQGTSRLFIEVVSLLGIADWYDWTEVEGGETPNHTPR